MPLFSNVNPGVPEPLDLVNYKPGMGEMLSVNFDQAMAENPMQMLVRNQAMAGLEDGIDISDAQTALDPTGDIDFEDHADTYARNAVPVEEQERQFMAAGLKGQLKASPGYNQQALDILMEHKRLENAIALMDEKSGFGGTVAGFGAGLAASFLDPVNLASAFLPTPGTTRILSMLAGATGPVAKAGIRFGTGALSGAEGAAFLEPVIYLGQNQVQADYSFTNSLLNVAFGSVMGGVMDAGGGLFSDWRKSAYVPPDLDNSESLIKSHADDYARHLREANPDMDKETIRQAALDYATLFDRYAQRWAYNEKRTIGEYYAQYRPEYRSWQDFEPQGWRDILPGEWRNPDSQVGDALEDMSWIGRDYEGLYGLNADAMSLAQFMENLGEWQRRFPDMADFDGINIKIRDLQEKGIGVSGNVLHHSMYLSPETDFIKFIEKSREAKSGQKQSYFLLSGDGTPDNVNVRIISDMAIHQKKRHPDMTAEDNKRLPQIIDNLNSDNTFPLNMNGQYGQRYLGIQTIDNVSYGYVFDIAGNNATFVTFFKDSQKGLLNWINEAKKRLPRCGGAPTSPRFPLLSLVSL